MKATGLNKGFQGLDTSQEKKKNNGNLQLIFILQKTLELESRYRLQIDTVYLPAIDLFFSNRSSECTKFIFKKYISDIIKRNYDVITSGHSDKVHHTAGDECYHANCTQFNDKVKPTGR